MIKAIELNTSPKRIALIAAGFVCLVAAFFFAKWCFANTVAARAPHAEVAEFAVSMAPADPQTHYALAVLKEKSFLFEDVPASLNEFGQATALAPHDFRLWLAYGRALERGGNREAAELALRRAAELAPHYAQVQWTLGNILIRSGKLDAGFAEIRRAAENDPAYRQPAITTAWQIFGGDLNQVGQSLGNSTNLNAALMVFLIGQKRLDEAIEIWSRLPVEAKKTAFKADGGQLFGALLAAKNYRKALQIQAEYNGGGAADAENFAVGKIYNGGFETELARGGGEAGVFDWQIAAGIQPQIGPNEEQKRGGNRSVFIVFNSNDGKDFRQISQTVVVEPNQKYVFSSFYKSNLKTAATLKWEIVDAGGSGAVLAATAAVAAAAADWTELTASFTVPEKTEAVIVRLAREPCKSIVCPISGNVWFDDLSFKQ